MSEEVQNGQLDQFVDLLTINVFHPCLGLGSSRTKQAVQLIMAVFSSVVGSSAFGIGARKGAIAQKHSRLLEVECPVVAKPRSRDLVSNTT